MKGSMLRVGTLCYATSQGIGHLAKSFYDAGVITDVVILRHRHNKSHPEWYPSGTPFVGTAAGGAELRALIERVDVMLFFETPYNWSLLDHCRTRGVKTGIMVMHEWWPERPPSLPDLMLCPSVLDLDYFPHGKYLPVPVDPTTWHQRRSARRFLHNAGHVGSREHKGTRQLLAALPHVRAPIELTVRCQEPLALATMLREVYGADRDPRLTIEVGDVPRAALFDGHDVYVAPEKYNGLSLPLQEARAAGMLVMTTDRRPHNTWLPTEPLISVERYEKVRVAPGYTEIDEAIVSPRAIAAKIDEWHGRDITDYSYNGRHWADANSWAELRPRYLELLENLAEDKP